MNPEKTVCLLQAAIIDPDPVWIFNAGEAAPELVESLARHGQLEPVLVAAGPGHGVISGRKRVLALRELGHDVAALRVDADEVRAGLMRLAATGAPEADGERLAAFRFFASRLDPESLARDVAPALGVVPKSKVWKQLQAWLALEGAGELRAHCLAGRLPLEAVNIFSRLEPPCREALEPFFREVSWSRGAARGFLTELYEASRALRTTVAALVQELGLAALTEQGLSPKDVQRRLTGAAHEARYPNLSALRRAYEKYASDLAAGSVWRIVQGDDFETDSLDLSVRVNSPEALARAVRDLESLAGSPLWQRIWGGRG